MKKDLYALILAGGASKRYGKNKILEKIGERTFLEIILEKVESLHLIPVIVYYYDEIANYKRNDRIFIKNPDPNTQQLDSMRLGIEKMHTDSLGFLVFLGDMPLIKNETIKMVIDEIQKEPEKIIVKQVIQPFSLQHITKSSLKILKMVQGLWFMEKRSLGKGQMINLPLSG